LAVAGVKAEIPRRSSATVPASGAPWEEIAADLADPRVHVRDVETERCGTFTVHLDDAVAPVTVWRLNALAKRGFFDGSSFHRVVPAFVVQGGCPRGDGWGGPGFVQRCETSDVPYEAGTVGMALAGKDTGGSQWFVTHRRTPHLDGRYTVFGNGWSTAWTSSTRSGPARGFDPSCRAFLPE
jgi:cyclophilin family peptidyl-prolyl cis-trans isomerase